MNFSEIAKVMSDLYIEKGKMPIGIKVNKEWMERQLQQTFTLRKGNENSLTSFTGLPIQEDDSISTYEFVYGNE